MIAQVEARRLLVQAELDSQRSPSERNRLGQFATPPRLARQIADHALSSLRQDTAVAFIEPSCGSGAFVAALLAAMSDSGRGMRSCVGVELDPRFAAAARDLWAAAGLRVIEADYLRWSLSCPGASANLLMANPPYVRHHHIPADLKPQMACHIRDLLGINVSGLAGLYVYFILLSHRLLAQDAVSAWLVPAEFLDVNYGRALREYLSASVELLRIHRFDAVDTQFQDALVSSAVIVFRNRRPDSVHLAEFTAGPDFAAPRTVVLRPTTSLDPVRKWGASFKSGSQTPSTAADAKVGDLLIVRRGVATGNNGFFIMERDRAAALGIREAHLQPVLPSARHVAVAVLDSADDGWPFLDHQLGLISCSLSESELKQADPALSRYLASASDQVRNGYLVTRRSPWYKQEERPPPLLFCTYMGRGRNGAAPFRFILNRSSAIATNGYLMLYPKPSLARALADACDPSAIARDLHRVLQNLAPETLQSGGRSYGGGLHKLEPKELEQIPLELHADSPLRTVQDIDLRTPEQVALFQ